MNTKQERLKAAEAALDAADNIFRIAKSVYDAEEATFYAAETTYEVACAEVNKEKP